MVFPFYSTARIIGIIIFLYLIEQSSNSLKILGGKTSNCSRTISLLVIIIILLFFSRDSFFVSRDIEAFFSLCDWPLKVMVPNDPLLDHSQNLQSDCPLCTK